MPDHSFPPILDGHNDTVLELVAADPAKRRSFFAESQTGHVDLPRARSGGMGGGFCAVFVPSPKRKDARRAMTKGRTGYRVPLPPPLDPAYALRFAHTATAALLRVARESDGAVRLVRSTDELAECLASGVFAMILHFEGADPIDASFDALETFYAAGLRSLGLVWSRPNRYGRGVPFVFPDGPDIGLGLTEEGKALVRACNALGILVDLSHLNEAGFWNVEAISQAPLVATHSGALALCASPRNLTDKQLDAIAASDGIVGVNFHIGFLREDGRSDVETSLSEIVRHVVYMVERIGIDHVAFGSDFDGATMPHDLRDAAGLPKLMLALRERGFDDEALVKLAHGNWLRVLKATWR